MAQGFLERMSPEHKAISGGSEPAAAVHPTVIQVMKEIGIDLTGRVPHRVDRAMLESADHVVSMGCDDPMVCEYPGRKVEDWSLDDPSKLPLDEVRRVRDEIQYRVEALLARIREGEIVPRGSGATPGTATDPSVPDKAADRTGWRR